MVHNYSGIASHVEGALCVSDSIASHVEGFYNYTEGYFSHAEGTGTASIGNVSHAQGICTEAYGDASHTMGINSCARNLAQFSQSSGQFQNIGDAQCSTMVIRTEQLLL